MPRPTFESDPSGLIAAIGAAVGAVLTLLVAFGVDLTDAQVDAILAVVATFGPLAVGFAIRRKAYAPDTVDQIAARAAANAHRDGYLDGSRSVRKAEEGPDA